MALSREGEALSRKEGVDELFMVEFFCFRIFPKEAVAKKLWARNRFPNSFSKLKFLLAKIEQKIFNTLLFFLYYKLLKIFFGLFSPIQKL